ncbi:MAG: PepSY domain-containing protein [Streptosporangiales bacterium]|nr:PepSY domain-containing protein [Streptosporangiales bacterium]
MPRHLRQLLLRLHFYAGVLVGPFVVVAAVTGMLYAACPQLERAVYRDQLTTEVRGPSLSLAQQAAAARADQPDRSLLAIRPAPSRGETTQVLFAADGLGPSERLAVFVDPVSGEVKGRLATYGSSGALPISTWIDGLHRNLHLGEPGRVYSELAASWLWLIAVAGLVLWWTRRRGRQGRARGSRRRTMVWHGTVGTWVVLGLVMLSATGLTWSRFAGANVTDLRAQLSWTTPTVASGPDTHHDDHGTAHRADHRAALDWDRAARSAAGVGLSGPIEVTAPTGDGGHVVVTELTRQWPTRADSVAVDPASGTVADVVRFADYPVAAKLARWGIDLHMGRLFGIWNQLGLILLAAAIVTLTGLGYRMWWQRRPTRGHRPRLGRPIARGALRRSPAAAIAVVVVLAAGVGAFLPVLGVSLLAFLAVDAVVGLVGARRSASVEQVGTVRPHPRTDPSGHPVPVVVGEDHRNERQPGLRIETASTEVLPDLRPHQDGRVLAHLERARPDE